jgi:signal transduction histidine kinase
LGDDFNAHEAKADAAMPDSISETPRFFSATVLLRLAVIFLPIALLTGIMILVLYQHDRGLEYQLYEQAGQHIVGLHADIINRELKAVQSDLLYLANQEMLIDFVSGGPTHKEQLEKEYSLFAEQRTVYDQIRYLDSAGQERIRINYAAGRASIVPEYELQAKEGRYYFGETMQLKRGEVFASPFDLNVEHGQIEQPLKPVIRFATPVFDKGGHKQGILILNYLGSVLTAKLATVSLTFPGWTVLLNRDGYFVRGRRAADEWGFMLGHHFSFATLYPEDWQRLVHSSAGQFRSEQGLVTFRTVSPVPNYPGQRATISKSLDPDARDPRLIVVAQTPADRLEQQSTRLWQRLAIFSTSALLLVLGLTWYLAHAAVLRRSQERKTAASEARLRALSTQLLTAQEDERRRLSRDLHDELGQVVTAVTLSLQRAAQTNDVAKKDELIGQAVRGSEILLGGIHEISARVRPSILDDLGLKDAVQNLLGSYERNTGIVPKAELHFEHHDIPPTIAENVYRIAQEALTNVSKHAAAKEVIVRLSVIGRQLCLEVCDRGFGFAPEAMPAKGLGILGMRERAELLHGTFGIRTAPGEGTEIRVTIPLK